MRKSGLERSDATVIRGGFISKLMSADSLFVSMWGDPLQRIHVIVTWCSESSPDQPAQYVLGEFRVDACNAGVTNCTVGGDVCGNFKANVIIAVSR